MVLIIYIVCEDGGSAGVFLQRALQARHGAAKVSVVPACGNKNLVSTVKGIQNLSRGDRVFLALDNNGEDFLTTALDTICAYCSSKSCRLSVTTYFCIEELLLSYTYVETLGRCENTYLLDLLSVIRTFLHTPSPRTGGYYLNPEFAEFKRNHRTRDREHLAFQLLNFILQGRRNQFKFEKGNLGSCWITDCAGVIVERKDYGCRLCIWKDENMTALAKANHFGSNCMQPFYVELDT